MHALILPGKSSTWPADAFLYPSLCFPAVQGLLEACQQMGNVELIDITKMVGELAISDIMKVQLLRSYLHNYEHTGGSESWIPNLR